MKDTTITKPLSFTPISNEALDSLFVMIGHPPEQWDSNKIRLLIYSLDARLGRAEQILTEHGLVENTR